MDCSSVLPPQIRLVRPPSLLPSFIVFSTNFSVVPREKRAKLAPPPPYFSREIMAAGSFSPRKTERRRIEIEKLSSVGLAVSIALHIRGFLPQAVANMFNKRGHALADLRRDGGLSGHGHGSPKTAPEVK